MSHKSAKPASSETEGAPLLIAAVKGLCPRCGAATLFAEPAHIADRCRACGQDFSAFAGGGRPFAFLTLLVAGLIFALAMVVEDWFYPPLWVQVTLWPIVTVVAVIGFLRLMKGASVIRAYHRKQMQQGNKSDDKPSKSG